MRAYVCLRSNFDNYLRGYAANRNREAVTSQSPGLERSGYRWVTTMKEPATLSGLRSMNHPETQRSLRQRWAGGRNRFAVACSNRPLLCPLLTAHCFCACSARYERLTLLALGLTPLEQPIHLYQSDGIQLVVPFIKETIKNDNN